MRDGQREEALLKIHSITVEEATLIIRIIAFSKLTWQWWSVSAGELQCK